jgi:hypothetical protein
MWGNTSPEGRALHDTADQIGQSATSSTDETK